MISDEYLTFEPSVDSEIRDERILARRIRIEKRREAEKKLIFQTDETEVEKLKEEISNAGKQLLESHKGLHRLKQEGLEIVTNVKITREAEEVQRRAAEEEAENLRKQKVYDENENSIGRLYELNQQWEVALSKTTVHELHEMLSKQKEDCDTLMNEKKTIIQEFRQVLKDKDKEYISELKRQSADIELLIHRMNEQLDQLTKAYKHELKQCEAIFIEERASMLAKMNDEWKKLLRERRQKEADYLMNRNKQVEFYEKQLNQMRIEDAEEYNKTKIKLEKDIQVLQQQIQEMRATYQLNQEKLEYNFQVLRKRDEENIITKSHQKKKITRLNDIVLEFKKKSNQGEKVDIIAYHRLAQEHEHLVQRYKSFLLKAKRTIDTNKAQFTSVWIMNEEECKQLARKLLKINKSIEEQQLGLKWNPPDLSFMDNVGPLEDPIQSSTETYVKFESKACGLEKPKPVEKKSEIQELEEETPKIQFEIDYFYEPLKIVDKCMDKIPKELMKHIFQLICDETGFLIEEKVWTLLSSLDANEQMLMKLDSILNVMQVTNDEDIKKLSLYFMKNSSRSKRIKNAMKSKFDVSLLKMKEEQDKIDDLIITSPFAPEPNKVVDERLMKSMENSLLPDGFREILYHPNDVLVVLKAFVTDHKGVFDSPSEEISKEDLDQIDFDVDSVTGGGLTTIADKNMDNSLTPIAKPQIKDLLMKHDLKKQYDECEIHTHDRDDTMDAEYWSKYVNVVDYKTSDAWDFALKHFDKYYALLGERIKLIKQKEILIRKNKRLDMMLKNAICRHVGES